MLKLDRTDLPAARLGNSDDAAVGSWVLAMGSPFGLSHSVSQGIIIGRGRHEVDLERNGVEVRTSSNRRGDQSGQLGRSRW